MAIQVARNLGGHLDIFHLASLALQTVHATVLVNAEVCEWLERVMTFALLRRAVAGALHGN
jgi:hypothetical protein